MAKRRPTRTDVSRLAGVAPSTVSLVLSGRGDQLGIAESTQKRVLESVQALGYVPNKLIRAVQVGRSHIIGIYLRWEQWSVPYGYWVELGWRVQEATAATDYQLLYHCAIRGTSTEEAFTRQAGGLVDGVLVFNSAQDEIAGRLLEVGLPTVEVGDIFSDLPCVGSDGAHGVRLALDHLKDRGYQRPAYLGHESKFEDDQRTRREMFVRHGSELWGRDLSGFTRTPDESCQLLEVLAELPDRPDCVICASDTLAGRLYAECSRKGIRVPQDLAMVGFDALQTLVPYPVLTSIQTPLDGVARLSVQKLLDLIEGKEIEQTTVLLPDLRIGDTT